MATASDNEIDLFVTDLNGNLRGKRLPANALDSLNTNGIKMPRSVLGVDFWGNDVIDNGLVYETGDSDGVCMPVAETWVSASWQTPPREQVLAMMFNPDGTPFGADPRQVLNAVVKQYTKLGLRPVVALELEFYLLDADSDATRRPLPPVLAEGQGPRVQENECYSIDELDALAPFFNEVRVACEQHGIPAQTIISEYGPGQFEIDLKHEEDPLLAADHAILFKRLVKGIAKTHGHAATFMAKPYGEHSGNGMHMHFSLLDNEGVNVFDDGSEHGSDTLRHAIAGLLETMADSMLIFAPHLNSYRRFMPGSHAPTTACWGYENRTVAIRVPDSPNVARRIEHRVSGADANPYLVVATILAGALYGIEKKMQAAPPTMGNAEDDSAQLPSLPDNWTDAIRQFSASDIHRQYLGEEFVKVFAAIKRQEHEALLQKVPDIEYDAYLGQL